VTPPYWLENLRSAAESTHGDEVAVSCEAVIWLVDLLETVMDEDPIADWSELLRDYYRGPPGVPEFMAAPDDTTNPIEVED